MHRNRFSKFAATFGFIIVAGCNDGNVSAPRSIAGDDALKSTVPSWAQTVTGVSGEGAQYSIFVPTNWNQDVVFYAHGIKDAAAPVALPTEANFPAFRDSLGVMGYAVAYSSFSENGWAVQDGIQKTHQLRGLFNSVAGKPRRAFIAGHSMGGLIATALAEKHPDQYVGALPMCGVMGGAQKQIDYIANVRTVFDYLYPGALPGDVLDMPISLNLNTQVLGPAQTAIIINPIPALTYFPRIDQTPVPFANVPELIQSILTAIAFGARGADDLLDRSHGHSPFFNNDPNYYTGALSAGMLVALNAGVKHFDETPDAANYLRNYYETTGNVRIPMLTIHTTRDPLVPIFHEGLYATRANEAGTSANLVQRSISRYGHCAFTANEMAQSFRDLVSWVDTGVRATP
jgi:pimeloyl-ACP methyl ester carboxylesterase